MQATKAAVKKFKTAIEKTQSIKVKKTSTIRDNGKETFTKKSKKTMSKKGKLNELLNIITATQRDENRIQ